MGPIGPKIDKALCHFPVNYKPIVSNFAACLFNVKLWPNNNFNSNSSLESAPSALFKKLKFLENPLDYCHKILWTDSKLKS